MAALFAVFFYFPFTFTKDLQPVEINHQVCDFTPSGSFETDADRAVIRTAQLNTSQIDTEYNPGALSRLWTDILTLARKSYYIDIFSNMREVNSLISSSILAFIHLSGDEGQLRLIPKLYKNNSINKRKVRPLPSRKG